MIDGDEPALLGGFVALDLTSGPARIAGSILAHLGMRVLRPSLAPAEEVRDPVDWFENSGKELCLSEDGETLRALVDAADIVLLDRDGAARWALDSDEVAASHPGAIVTMITPFGGSGPLADAPATELTLQAAGGLMWWVGYPDRPPVPLPGSQAQYQAAAQGVVAALGALYSRERGTGGGDLIDVSMQEAACDAILSPKPTWYVSRYNVTRSDMSAIGGTAFTRVVWQAKDGYISWRLSLGIGRAPASMGSIIEWMMEETGTGEELLHVPWGEINVLEVADEDLRAWEAAFARFFETRTRAELFAGARERGLLMLPILAPEELVVDEHVQVRGTMVQAKVDGTSFAVPGFPVRAKGVHRGRVAPRIVDPALPTTRVEARASTGRSRPPLDGLKILDFGWAIAGPVTTRILGMLGATVLKVETNTRLDSTRASPPFVGRPSRDRSGVFSNYNNNKLGITLDLNVEGSRAVVERLVRWADVVAENFSGGRMERWRLGFEDLREWNPELVMLRSSTWGQDGPYRSAPANGVVLGGFAGFSHLIGWPDRPPVPPGDPYTDRISPWFAAAAVVAALIARMRRGGPELLDLAQLDCALNFLGPEFARVTSGAELSRRGPLRCDPYPSGVFRAPGDDEWCVLEVEHADQWRDVCGIVPGLAGCEDLAPDELEAIALLLFTRLEDFFLSAPPDSTVGELQRAGVPAAKVAKPEDLYRDPQFHHRGHFVELEHPSMVRYAYEMPPFRFAHRPIELVRSPRIGEHNGLVLGEFLGYSDDEIADFYAAGVVN